MTSGRELDAIQPNAGVEARFQTRLLQIVVDLDFTVRHEITRLYQPVEVAMDDIGALKDAFKKIVKFWSKRIDGIAPDIAKEATKDALGASDAAFMASLRNAGFTIKFQMTDSMRTAYEAMLVQNVSLIKDIPAKYLTDVQAAVMRSVAAGRDIGALANELQDRFNITRNRAILIAQHQNNLATATFNRVRMLESGITQAVWRHSRAGNHPRPSHVAANGTVYEVEKGCLIDGEYIAPGTAINCKCVAIPIVPGLPPRPLQRVAEAV